MTVDFLIRNEILAQPTGQVNRNCYFGIFILMKRERENKKQEGGFIRSKVLISQCPSAVKSKYSEEKTGQTVIANQIILCLCQFM